MKNDIVSKMDVQLTMRFVIEMVKSLYKKSFDINECSDLFFKVFGFKPGYQGNIDIFYVVKTSLQESDYRTELLYDYKHLLPLLYDLIYEDVSWCMFKDKCYIGYYHVTSEEGLPSLKLGIRTKQLQYEGTGDDSNTFDDLLDLFTGTRSHIEDGMLNIINKEGIYTTVEIDSFGHIQEYMDSLNDKYENYIDLLPYHFKKHIRELKEEGGSYDYISYNYLIYHLESLADMYYEGKRKWGVAEIWMNMVGKKSDSVGYEPFRKEFIYRLASIITSRTDENREHTFDIVKSYPFNLRYMTFRDKIIAVLEDNSPENLDEMISYSTYFAGLYN